MVEYQPGVCNIGPTERRMRYRFGVVGLAAAAAFTAWVLLTGQPDTYYAGTFVLSAMGFLGYLQARMQFCVQFAALAKYDTGDGSASVTDRELRRKDRMHALEILAYSVGLALAVSVLAYAADLYLAF